jgi:hypothetical protein
MKLQTIEESDWVVMRLLVAMEDNTPEYFWNVNMDYRKSCWYLYGKYPLRQIHVALNSIREENKKHEIHGG